jgi:hypothetical protein
VMELNLIRLPDETVCISGFGGDDGGVVGLDAVPKLIIWSSTAYLAGCCSRLSRWCSFNLVSVERSVFS